MQIVLPKFDDELEDEYGLETFEDADRFGEFEILGTDDRQLVTDTDPIPFRFVCCLGSLFRGRGLTPQATANLDEGGRGHAHLLTLPKPLSSAYHACSRITLAVTLPSSSVRSCPLWGDGNADG
jgi:hypothetical protein